MSAPRIAALRELAEEAVLEKRDFVYEATEQLRRFLDVNRERLREVGRIKLVDDEQDYLVFDPVDETWTTRLTYQDPADSEWYDEEQTVDAVSEVVELYNLSDILSWFADAARDPMSHLVVADELATHEEVVEGPEPHDEDWQAGLPTTQQETIAAQRLWQLADAYRTQIGDQQKQVLREFAANAEEVLARTGDLVLLDEESDTLLLRSDGRFETSLDLSDMPNGTALNDEPHRVGLTVTDARTVAEVYDPTDVLQWVTDALTERYPAVDFTAVYE